MIKTEKMKKYCSQVYADEVAQRVGEFIEIKDIRTPVDLVNAARPKSSPIHNDFDWDTDTALEQYLREQAKKYMRFIRVIDDDEGEEKDAHAFYAVRLDEEEREGAEEGVRFQYYTHDEVEADKDKQERLGRVYYGKLLAFCRNAEEIGLAEGNEVWERLINYVRRHDPHPE